MADAADIINAAARRRAAHPRIEVKGVDPNRRRDPYREIVVVEMAIPHCDQFPGGTRLYVNPRQVKAHEALYPGATVVRELRKKVPRGARPQRLLPEGHRKASDFLGTMVAHRDRS